MNPAQDMAVRLLAVPSGFEPQVLACAWCDSGDRCSLLEHVMSEKIRIDPSKNAYRTETKRGPVPTHLVREWVERHADCEARWSRARIRIEGAS